MGRGDSSCFFEAGADGLFLTYCECILYSSVNENRSFLKSMLLNHTKPITKQEERKRAAQRLLYFSPAKGGKG